ncbi:MAG: electron transport complex subunit E [Clostridia bacterium]
MKKNSKAAIVSNGIIKNNPIFRLVLGMCPTLALSTAAMNGIYMGLAVTFVLICSNALISLLRKVIPDKVRIPAFVLIIATFVTLIDMILGRFMPDVYEILGLYLPLIVVNCIILARAEAFASSNKVIDSALDGLGMGLGFTLSLTVIGAIREFIGAGSVFGFELGALPNVAMSVVVMAPGGFLTLGLLMALLNYIQIRKKNKATVPVAVKEGK